MGGKCKSRMRIDSMVSLARALSGVPIAPDSLDHDPWALTFWNGTLNLKTGGLSPHNQGSLITKLLAYGYHPYAVLPLWDHLLEDSPPDPETHALARPVLVGSAARLAHRAGEHRALPGVFARTIGNNVPWAAIVLISGYHMFDKKVPHWVLAHGDDGSHIVIHDPWVADERGETISDAANLPIPYETFDRIARFGKVGLRAAVFLKKREGTEAAA